VCFAVWRLACTGTSNAGRGELHALCGRPQSSPGYLQRLRGNVEYCDVLVPSREEVVHQRGFSGLDVVRYDAEALHNQFGARFLLVESTKELHATPWGATQQFLYCYCKVE